MGLFDCLLFVFAPMTDVSTTATATTPGVDVFEARRATLLHGVGDAVHETRSR